MTADARAIFDRDAFERQTGGDAVLRREIVQMFLEDCPLRVAEIRDAIACGDVSALVASAHGLKGSAAYLAASVVRGCAADLERLARDGRIGEASDALTRLDAAVTQLLPVLHILDAE